MRAIYTFFSLAVCLILMSFIELDQKLPNIFIIGDSISIQYGPFLKEAAKGFFNYDRLRDNGQALEDLDNPIGANGGDSKRVLEILKKFEKQKFKEWDYLVLNCGLHDIKTSKDGLKKQVNENDYESNLIEIIKFCKKNSISLIWINSTPVYDEIHNKKSSFLRFGKDINNYNLLAEKIMKKNKIPIVDLYTFTKKFLPEGYNDHVHFKNEIRAKQADYIVGNLTSIIKNYRK